MSSENEQKVIQKKFTPIDRNIVVDIIQGPNRTFGGIIIPDTAIDKWTTPICRVIAVGPEVKYVKEGDVILVTTKIESATIKYDEDETYIIAEQHVYGIIDKYRTDPVKPVQP